MAYRVHLVYVHCLGGCHLATTSQALSLLSGVALHRMEQLSLESKAVCGSCYVGAAYEKVAVLLVY